MHHVNHMIANEQRLARIAKGEFRVSCRDGRVIGTKTDKIPLSFSTKALANKNVGDNKSVWNRPGYKAKKQARGRINRAARADLNRSFRGETKGSQDGKALHTALMAIAKGTL